MRGTPRSRTLLVLVAGSVALGGAAIAIGEEGPTLEDIFSNPVNEATKEEIIEEDRLIIELSEARSPAPKDLAPPINDPGDIPVWVEGIYEGDADWPSGSGYDFNTIWQGVHDGMNVRVYAGGLIRDPSVGIVLVDLVDPESWGHIFKRPFEAPIPGPLRIEDAKGTVLTLSGAKGSSVRFDVASLGFVSP
jgi:hypothetical protein